jgi:magnesium-transporting ATPase (P-type)
MPEQNKSEPTELQRVKHALAQLDLLRVGNLVSALAALVAALSTVGTNLKILFTLNTVPTVYLVVIATAVGLAISLSIGFLVYQWRLAVKRIMIQKLRASEAELFRRIEARLPDLLGGKL